MKQYCDGERYDELTGVSFYDGLCDTGDIGPILQKTLVMFEFNMRAFGGWPRMQEHRKPVGYIGDII